MTDPRSNNEWSASPETSTDSNWEISRFQAEIAELRRTVAALRKSEDQFAKAFHSSADALIISRLSDGAVMEVNQSYLQIVGYEAAEIVGKDRRTLQLAADTAVRDKLIQLLIHDGSYRDEEMQLRQRSGAIRDARISAETFDIAGEVRVLARIRDITAQKEAERALRASDERLRMALAAARMGIWEWDIPSDQVIWSLEVAAILGLTEGELVSSLQGFLDRIHPDDRGPIGRRIVELMQPEKADTPYDVEHRIVWPSGEIRWVASKGSMVFDSAGRAIRMLGTVMDATERKQAEEQAQQYLTDLWRMARIRTADQTASSLAHELNQPLTAIALQAGIVSSLASAGDGGVSPDLAVALREIAEQAQRGGAIIRALRDFVKRGITSREPVQLNDVVREVVRLIEAWARQHQVSILLSLRELPKINADRIQIAQVVMNLLQNALEALRDRTAAGRRIEVSTRSAAQQAVEVIIHDSGPGIPPEIRERVFERFYTTKDDGIGLGLAIARSIVESHGGELRLDSTFDEGTTFIFRLPIAVAESP
jgi:two-component system sensor kinase FixL